MAKMTPEEVQAILAAEKADSLSSDDSTKLSDERTRAMDYYLGDVSSDVPAAPNASKAVSNDVADTIEGMMPSFMEIFFTGEHPIKFEPVGAEDEEKAKQETDYINHVLLKKNRGFVVIYSFIKDALLSKLGVVKVWWEEKESEERETYKGIDDVQYGLLVQDPEVEIKEHRAYAAPPAPYPAADDEPEPPDGPAGPAAPPGLGGPPPGPPGNAAAPGPGY